MFFQKVSLFLNFFELFCNSFCSAVLRAFSVLKLCFSGRFLENYVNHTILYTAYCSAGDLIFVKMPFAMRNNTVRGFPFCAVFRLDKTGVLCYNFFQKIHELFSFLYSSYQAKTSRFPGGLCCILPHFQNILPRPDILRTKLRSSAREVISQVRSMI